MVPLLCKVLKNKILNDKETINDCLWALSNILGSYDNYFLPITKEGDILEAIYELLKVNLVSTLVPSIRIIGHLISG